TFLCMQCHQNRPLRWADSMPPHFRVEELRHHPRYPAQVEADTVFRRREIQLFCHVGVYMHYWDNTVNRDFSFIFCRGQRRVRITPARKSLSPSDELRRFLFEALFSCVLVAPSNSQEEVVMCGGIQLFPDFALSQRLPQRIVRANGL
ncbi:MAG TPA: hypothetical protein VGF73_08990, partial [Chthoniobacterales bacterium]